MATEGLGSVETSKEGVTRAKSQPEDSSRRKGAASGPRIKMS